MSNVKLSQIASGGAFVAATDNIVTVRNGTTDVLTTITNPSANVNSVSGDGTIISNSGSTGAVTLTLANTPTGTGAVVLANSPALVTPALGTPASGTLTNCDGTASGLTAGHVTNATFTTALTVNTGTLTLTANAANTSVLTIGAGAVSVSGSNTGDQTITLTGAVTGSGTGSFATTIATPGTLTVSSTNSTATAHTHAITSSSTPGAAASILATDSSGIIGSTGTRIVKGWFTDLTVTNAIAASITGTAADITASSNTSLTSLSNLATIGTISSGTWHGTAVGAQYGGTGQDTHSSTGFATVSSGTWSVGSITFGFAVNTASITADGTYALVVYAPCACTITAVKQISSNSGGTVTANFKINTTSITGLSAISVTSTAQDVSASGANTVAAGDAINLTTTSSTSLTNLQFLILATRTA